MPTDSTQVQARDQSGADSEYDGQIARALQRTYEATLAFEPPGGPLELHSGRCIIFSDQHKGARNAADDFSRCERAYRAALSYYGEREYRLIELGDVEELWEERPGPVLKAYGDTFSATKAFAQAGRYMRVWGNHDDLWQYPAKVSKLLGNILGPGLSVREGVRLPVVDGGETIGDLFLLHGHQGTVESDRWSWLSRLFVRFIWRPIQRLTKWSLNTPAKDWELRDKHNLAMYRWALHRPGIVLVAGHVHRPVFESQALTTVLQKQADEAVARVERMGAPEAGATTAQEDATRAQEDVMRAQEDATRAQDDLDWARAQDADAPAEDRLAQVADTPCYFNTGCCAYRDGTISGIEIFEGEIRLVRWSPGQGVPSVLARTSLADVFAQHSGAKPPLHPAGA